MAWADLVVSFEEAAPKDRFVIENQSGCGLKNLTLTLDLRASEAGLLFDTTPGGAGINVAQPFEVASGFDFVQSISPVTDGDRVATIQLSQLPVKQRVVLTVDVDDSLEISPMGQTMISGSEILGAAVSLSVDRGQPSNGRFDGNGEARTKLKDCLNLS